MTLLLQLLKRLFCRHKNLEVVRKIYGDEINAYGGKRWVCDCSDCGARVIR